MSYQSDIGLLATLINGRPDAHEALVRICARHEALMGAARAACEATKLGCCLFPNCLCEDAARDAINAALAAALKEG